MPKWNSIVFVCTGNSCRSPMAEGIAKKEATERGLDISVSSAGTHAVPFGGATDNAVAACAEIGVDISGHRSRDVYDVEYDSDTLFAAMQWGHADNLTARFIPKDQITLLGRGIPDPYGGDLDTYRACRDAISQAVSELFDALAQDDTGSGVIISPMTAEDLEAVCAMEKDCFSDAWSRQSFEEEIDNPLANFIVAKSDDEVIGYGGILTVCDTAELPKVCVHPKSRRQGVGRKILSALCKTAREKGANELSLEVRVSNSGAIGLYENMGFEIVGKRPNFYSTPTEDAYIMIRKLA